MYRYVNLSALLIFLFAAAISFAQVSEGNHVVHIQKWKFNSMPDGDDAKAFGDMLQKQATVQNKDPRVVRATVLRHFWGNDSRDLIMITEFKTIEDMFALYQEMDGMMESAYSKDELDSFNSLWNKYVGQHSDEIYQELTGTRK